MAKYLLIGPIDNYLDHFSVDSLYYSSYPIHSIEALLY